MSTPEANERFSKYQEYNRLLRTWFVAYGIGGPVLFLTQKDITDAIKASGNGRIVVYAFLVGVASQVLIALINKWSIWTEYYGFENSSFKSTRRFGFATWLNTQFWIDMFCDVVSIAFLGFATLRVLLVFA